MEERLLRGYVDVGAVEDFDEGEAVRVSAGDLNLALFRSGGRFYALIDQCPHAEAPLSDGSLVEHELSCSWHAWKFDVRSGESLLVSGIPPVQSHDVQVSAGRVMVAAEPRPPPGR